MPSKELHILQSQHKYSKISLLTKIIKQKIAPSGAMLLLYIGIAYFVIKR